MKYGFLSSHLFYEIRFIAHHKTVRGRAREEIMERMSKGVLIERR